MVRGGRFFCTQIFVYGLGCCRVSAYAPGFGQIAAVRRRSERRKARARPPMLTLEDWEPLQRPNLTTRRRGRRAPKGANGAHGAASGARTARGREADRFLTVAANAAKARATPATKPPVFRRAGAQLFFAPLTEIFRIAARQRHGEKRGVVRGEKNTAGAATRTRQSGRRKTKRLETADASGRRRAAAAPEGRKGHAPARHEDARESAASGQADQTDDGEAASGRGSNCPPPRAPETARPRQRTAKRRRGGRRRRRPGGTRARLLAAHSPAISAERTFRAHQQRARRRRKRRARGAGRGHDRRTRRTEGRGTNSPAPRPEGRKAKRTGDRTSHRAQSGRARRRSGRIWPPVRLCGGFFRWWWVAVPISSKKR